MMDIDLSRKNISELRFDNAAGDGEASEAAAAQAVTSINAAHNEITRVVGLGAVFSRLTELVLSHNALNVMSTPVYVARQQARHASVMAAHGRGVPAVKLCSGLPTWVAALPPTLEVLNVSHNHLSSLVTCTCGQAEEEASGAAESAGDDEDDDTRLLLHACPLALSLVFPRTRLPHLRRLDLSHNALSVSLQESDEMEELWQSHVEVLGPGADALLPPCAAAEVDLSFNPGLAAVNCLLACAPGAGAPALRTLSIAECGVEDLVGLSGAALYAPQLATLRLHPTPLSVAVHHSSPSVLADFLQSLLLPVLARSPPGGSGSPSDSVENTAIAKALADVAANRLSQLDAALRRTPVGALAGSGALSAVTLCVYAALVKEVVPRLAALDGIAAVPECIDALVLAVQSALLSHATANRSTAAVSQDTASSSAHPSQRPPSQGGSPTRLRRQNSLRELAAAVTPQLRPKVVLLSGTDAARGASTPSAPEAAPPLRLATPAGAEDSSLVRTPRTSGSSGAALDPPGGPGVAPGSRFQAALAALQPLVHGRSSGGGPPSEVDVSAASREPTDVSRGGAATVLLSSSDADGEDGAGQDWFTPVSLDGDPAVKARYESLCAEAAELERRLHRSRDRREAVGRVVAELRLQLTEHRQLIADQRKTTAALREQRDSLKGRMEAAQAKLKKRQKEVAYGNDALRSRITTTREQERLRQLEERERAIEKRERQWKRRMQQLGTLSVNYNAPPVAGGGSAGKPLRSVQLREAATRKKMEELEAKDPLAYSPTRFQHDIPPHHVSGGGERPSRHSASRRRPSPAADHQRRHRSPSVTGDGDTSPRSDLRSQLQADEAAYFASYGSDDGEAVTIEERSVHAAASAYCRSLSQEQRSQLQDALVSSGSHSPFYGSSNGGSRRSSPQRVEVHLPPPPPPPPPPRSEGPRKTSLDLPPPPPFPEVPRSTPAATSPPPAESPASASAAVGLAGGGSPGRDLSALSLTELFEAAASIRRRQLALQQLQDEWQQQKQASSVQLPVPVESPLPDVSPFTPPPPTTHGAAQEPVAAVDERGESSGPPSTVSVSVEGGGEAAASAPPSVETSTYQTGTGASLDTSAVPSTSRALFS